MTSAITAAPTLYPAPPLAQPVPWQPPAPTDAPVLAGAERDGHGSGNTGQGQRLRHAPDWQAQAARILDTPRHTPAANDDRPAPHRPPVGVSSSALFLTQQIAQEVIPEPAADVRRQHAEGTAAYEQTLARDGIILGPAAPYNRQA